jgi:hypothetical protein
MRLQEPPVRLRFDDRQLHVLRWYAKIEPRRHVSDFEIRVTAEHHLRDDLLHPRRARLRIRRNDDVVVAELQVVPDGGVEMVAVQLPRFPWQNIRRTHASSQPRVKNRLNLDDPRKADGCSFRECWGRCCIEHQIQRHRIRIGIVG